MLTSRAPAVDTVDTSKKGARAGPRVGCLRGGGDLHRPGGRADSTDNGADRAPAPGAWRPRGYERPHHGALEGGGALSHRGHAREAAETLSGGRRAPSKGRGPPARARTLRRPERA